MREAPVRAPLRSTRSSVSCARETCVRCTCKCGLTIRRCDSTNAPGSSSRRGWRCRRRCEALLKELDVAPAAVFVAGVAHDTDGCEAKHVVQLDRCVVGQRDAGDRRAKAAALELVEERRVQRAT